MAEQRKKAVVLLSGGLDSQTCLAIAQDQQFNCFALSFDYGQRHRLELKNAENIAIKAGLPEAQRLVVSIDLRKWGGSALTSDDIAVPDAGSQDNIPDTYVPARNLIFLSFATAWAETIGARDVFIGVNALDYSGYPDCREEFIRSFNHSMNLGTCACVEGWSFKLHAPLQKLSKAQIIRKGTALGVDYSLSHSCYNPGKNNLACGRCDSCSLRRKGFSESGIADPTIYSQS